MKPEPLFETARLLSRTYERVRLRPVGAMGWPEARRVCADLLAAIASVPTPGAAAKRGEFGRLGGLGPNRIPRPDRPEPPDLCGAAAPPTKPLRPLPGLGAAFAQIADH